MCVYICIYIYIYICSRHIHVKNIYNLTQYITYISNYNSYSSEFLINHKRMFLLFVSVFFRAEYSAFWKCVQAGAAYLVTQLCKMMFLATFFPASDIASGQFDLGGVRKQIVVLSYFFLHTSEYQRLYIHSDKSRLGLFK